MTILLVLLLVAAAIALDTMWVALAKANRIGKFKIHQQGTAIFRFESSVGMFSVLLKDRLLEFEIKKRKGRINLSEVRGLEYRVHEERALFEELFFGFDITDFFAAYRDGIDWYSINILTLGGERVPVYISGHYMRREFLAGWYFELQARALERIGVLVNVEAETERVLAVLRSRLGNLSVL